MTRHERRPLGPSGFILRFCVRGGSVTRMYQFVELFFKCSAGWWADASAALQITKSDIRLTQ